MTREEATAQAVVRANLLRLPWRVYGPDPSGDYWTAGPNAWSLWRDRVPVCEVRP